MNKTKDYSPQADSFKAGRLSRDLEVRPVIEKVKRYMENYGCNDLSMVIDNLKPLIEEK